MGVLVEDLLDLARLDEEPEVQVEPLDLRPLARDAALDVRAAAPGRKITVIDRTADAASGTPARPLPALPKAEPPTPKPAHERTGTAATPTACERARDAADRLQRDPGRPRAHTSDRPRRAENKVRQVIANLLGNARRFSSEDVPIELVVDSDRIAGTGSIATSSTTATAFRHRSASRSSSGSGVPTPRAPERPAVRALALAIAVASIVTALNGQVHVDETPGGGATFTVTLPLAPAQATPEHLLEDTQPLDPSELHHPATLSTRPAQHAAGADHPPIVVSGAWGEAASSV